MRENTFEHKKEKPGLSANRPSNNWVQVSRCQRNIQKVFHYRQLLRSSNIFKLIKLSLQWWMCFYFFLFPDNEGPVVTYCPPDQDITGTTRKSVVTWSNPQFRDNSNSRLKIKCSHRSGTAFYWGTWKVHCTAHDSNPNNDPAVCQFVLRLKRKWRVSLHLFCAVAISSVNRVQK